jgi:hypothetical protein
LVTWDWAGNHAAVPPDKVVAGVLAPQLGPQTVKRIVEVLYAAREYEAIDKLDTLTHNLYPADYGTVRLEVSGVGFQNVTYQGEIFCGHNPFLHARLVDNLRPRDNANPELGLVWDERPKPTGRIGEVHPDAAPLEPPSDE